MSALQDPSSFGPPPKHRDFYGEEAAVASVPVSTMQPEPNATVPSTSHARHVPTPAARPAPTVPERVGQTQREESPEKSSGPFQVDTTGLSTANLPPPPQHRDKRTVGSATPPRAPAYSGSPVRTASAAVPATRAHPPPPPSRANVATQPSAAKPKPSLPPRVPPRSAVAAGASNAVPGTPPPPYSEREQPAHSTQPAAGELQERLARMRARIDNAESGEASSNTNMTPAAPPPLPLSSKPR